MGTSISYYTKQPLAENLRNEITEFLEVESSRREWWAESILFFDVPTLPGHICGDTKIFCNLDEDDGADCYMAMKDTEFIVALLEAVSLNHGVDWEIRLSGELVGLIQKGQREPELAEVISMFGELGEGAYDFSEYDRDELLQKYPDR